MRPPRDRDWEALLAGCALLAIVGCTALGVWLVDVRTPAAVDRAHVPPLEGPALDTLVDDPTGLVITIDRHGQRIDLRLTQLSNVYLVCVDDWCAIPGEWDRRRSEAAALLRRQP